MIPLRRQLVGAGLALLALSPGASRISSAQSRQVRIGYLAPRQGSTFLAPILKRLGELGYVEGKNLVVDYRSADGVAERFPLLARDLMRAKCDLIFAVGPEQSARAVLEAKAGVPVVILAVDYDPVKAGLIASLQRPGGNVTGMVLLQPILAAKRLELLREVVPRAKRILVLADPFTTEQLEAIRQAAGKLRAEIVVETFAAPPYDFAAAFARGVAAGTEVVLPLNSPVLTDQRMNIFKLTMKHRLPSMGNDARYAEAGHLLSYGVNTTTVFVRAGDIAVSILKGAKAGDLPVEQPTEFELVVNLKTAKALKISIPQSVLLRANRVIE